MDPIIKQETVELSSFSPAAEAPFAGVIDLTGSDSESEGETPIESSLKRTRVSNDEAASKKMKAGDELPAGFLDPLPAVQPVLAPIPLRALPLEATPAEVKSFRQFWKAGDYEGHPADSAGFAAGMDHVRVHPKFLHSNATSHKWALGALAELLDNSIDEACHGATYVKINMLENKRDGSKMLLVEDNGGGMHPDKMRRCMSLGYSVKSKMPNTIGQYGNGFKTSTMRLGADVIVFSRSCGVEGRSPTQSIGMLSYTFLRNTGKEDIVVPMIDYEKEGKMWCKMSRSTSDIWNNNLQTILQWSPYCSQAELLGQFDSIADQGTRIVIYNLWEDDQGDLELDFSVDEHDIQIRGVNRDEKKIQMAKQFPNSRHFLTYRHSLRSYASILYRKLPPGFRMILRGKEVEHHNIANDMMLKQEVTYRPQPGLDGVPKDPNMITVVTLGFVKDAKDHIDVQGFNVYHKNRLIKPFWRVWNAAGSDGRGVIGVLEANFVEPAHDKQGFERTTVLARLEQRLLHIQKTYWTTNCHHIGYAPRRTKKHIESAKKGVSSEPQPSSQLPKSPDSVLSDGMSDPKSVNRHLPPEAVEGNKCAQPSKEDLSSARPIFLGRPNSSNESDPEAESSSWRPQNQPCIPNKFSDSGRTSRKPHNQPVVQNKPFGTECNSVKHLNQPSVPRKSVGIGSTSQSALTKCVGNLNSEDVHRTALRTQSMADFNTHGVDRPASKDRALSMQQLIDENSALKNRIKEMELLSSRELQYERDRVKSVTEELEEAQRKMDELTNEQEAIIELFSKEKIQQDKEEKRLRNKLKEATDLINKLLNNSD